jgi:hypothetical protein
MHQCTNAHREEEDDSDDPEAEDPNEEEETEHLDDQHPIPFTSVPSTMLRYQPSAWDQLAARARIALNRIADQYQFPAPKRRQLERSFATFVSLPKAPLGLSKSGDGLRYNWLMIDASDDHASPDAVSFAQLSEIALRLEPSICSEAPTERTLGQQGRFLSPHRMRMKPDLLIARMTLEET